MQLPKGIIEDQVGKEMKMRKKGETKERERKKKESIIKYNHHNSINISLDSQKESIKSTLFHENNQSIKINFNPGFLDDR